MSNLVVQQPAWLVEQIEDEDLIRDLLADKRSRNTINLQDKET
jgi:hypothetical protein